MLGSTTSSERSILYFVVSSSPQSGVLRHEKSGSATQLGAGTSSGGEGPADGLYVVQEVGTSVICGEVGGGMESSSS